MCAGSRLGAGRWLTGGFGRSGGMSALRFLRKARSGPQCTEKGSTPNSDPDTTQTQGELRECGTVDG